jgi:hypothetical protein
MTSLCIGIDQNSSSWQLPGLLGVEQRHLRRHDEHHHDDDGVKNTPGEARGSQHLSTRVSAVRSPPRSPHDAVSERA